MISLLKIRAESNGIERFLPLLILSNPINEAIRSQIKTSKEVSLHATFSNLSRVFFVKIRRLH